MPNPAPTITPRKSGWSPARRATQAKAIRRWQPWANSTGPRTASGKARAAQNAAKPHTRHRREAEKLVKSAITAQARYLLDLKAYHRARHFFAPNELLKKDLCRWRRRLRRDGRKVTNALCTAFSVWQICEMFGHRQETTAAANDTRRR